MRATRPAAAAVLGLAAWSLGVSPHAHAQQYDVLICNARVLDGTGNPWFRADLAIAGDRIVRIGDLSGVSDDEARRVVDARDRYVSPGFVDLHSHADRAMTSEHAEARRTKSLNSQGLTTVVGGADGRNVAWPVSAEIAALRDGGHAMNFVPMVGHSTVRQEVMGDDYERAATPEEIARMQALVREGMEAGAWGLGAGIASRPGAHPRHFGAFTRKIARFVKDLKAISLPFAVRSMTGLPARIVGLEDRGLLREGYKADLVVFDLERLRDRATVLEPDRYSEGVDYVMVNGVFTIDDGRFTDEMPGEVILRSGRPVS